MLSTCLVGISINALFILLTLATMPCDHIEYTKWTNGIGTSHTIPAGVCVPKDVNEISSFWSIYSCDSTTAMNITYYSTEDCSGAPNSSEDFTTKLKAEGVTDYTLTCCSGNPCEYSLVTIFPTKDCSYDISTATHTYSSFSIIGLCHSYSSSSTKYTSCSNGVLSWEDEFNAHCDGSGSKSYSQEKDNTCVQYWSTGYGYHKKVICDTATTTCLVPTATPITTTNNPSTNPSNTPTVDESNNPSFTPSIPPSTNPFNAPSIGPTANPSDIPSHYPSNTPTVNPSVEPSAWSAASSTLVQSVMDDFHATQEMNSKNGYQSGKNYGTVYLMIVVVFSLLLLGAIIVFCVCWKRSRETKINEQFLQQIAFGDMAESKI